MAKEESDRSSQWYEDPQPTSHQEKIRRLEEIAKEDGIRGEIAASTLCPCYMEYEDDLRDYFSDLLQDGEQIGVYIKSVGYWKALEEVQGIASDIADEIGLWWDRP